MVVTDERKRIIASSFGDANVIEEDTVDKMVGENISASVKGEPAPWTEEEIKWAAANVGWRPGQAEVTPTVTPTTGEPIPTIPGVVSRELGVVRLSSYPSKAMILHNNTFTGWLTPQTFYAPVGNQTFEIQKSGYKRSRLVLNVRKNLTAEAHANLVNSRIPTPGVDVIEKTGEVNITSSPTRGAIYINDVNIGLLTPEKLFLPLGTFTIACEVPGYEVMKQQVSVVEGKQEIHFKFQRPERTTTARTPKNILPE